MSLEDLLNADSGSLPAPSGGDKVSLKKNDSSALPAHDEKEYAAYKQAVSGYMGHLLDEARTDAEAANAKAVRNSYRSAWKTAAENALALFKKQAGEQQAQADEKRASYRKKAQSIKDDRLAEINGRKAAKEAQLRTLAGRRQLEQAEEKKILDRISQLRSHASPMIQCDKQIEDMIRTAGAKGWLSKTQKGLSLLPPANFLSFCGGDISKFAEAEDQIKKSGFMKGVQDIETKGKDYWRFSALVSLIAVPVLVVLMAVAVLVGGGVGAVVGSVGSFMAFSGMAGTLGLIVSGILLYLAKLGVKYSTLEVITFIAMIAAGILVTMICGGAERASASLFNLVVMPVFGGASVFFLTNFTLMRKLLMKTPPAKKIMYMHLFANIEKLDPKKNRVFAKGEGDRAVVCYLRHNDYIGYFGDAEKAKLSAQAQTELAAAQKKIIATDAEMNSIQNEINAFDAEYKQAELKNKETDRKLEEKLRSVDEKYGASELPDFNKRANLLPADTAELEKIEALMSVKPGSVADLDGAKAAVNAYVHIYTDKLDALRSVMSGEVAVIRKYCDSTHTPPLALSDGTYNYRLEPYFCLLNALDPTRVSVIEHGFQPISFVYADGSNDNNEENEVLFIRELWQAFAKIAPGALFNFSIVDDAKYLRLPLGYPRSEISLFDKYYSSKYEPGILPDDVYPICGLYAQNDTKRLGDDIFRKIDNIQEYSKKNSISNADIVNVNRSMTAGNLHNAEPWNVVLYIIPGEEYSGYSDTADFLGNMLKSYRSNSERGGFLPIIISAYSNISKKWLPVTEQARRIGRTYALDLSDLTVKEAD